MGDAAYSPGFPNFFRFAGANPAALPVLVALDSATCALAKAENYTHLCAEHGAQLEERLNAVGPAIFPRSGEGAREMVLRFKFSLTKYLAPLLAIEAGKTAILSEADIFWQHDAVANTAKPGYEGFDFLVSSHVGQPHFQTELREINSGFFVARPTRAAVAMLTTLVEYSTTQCLHAMQNRTWEQKALDRLLRSNANGPLAPGETPPWEWPELFPALPMLLHPVRWRRLPSHEYTHNRQTEVWLREDTVTLHVSWNMPTPQNRIQCAEAVGLFPGYVYPVEGPYAKGQNWASKCENLCLDVSRRSQCDLLPR